MGITIKKARHSVMFVLDERVGIEHAVSFHTLVKENIDRSLSIDMTKLEYIDTSIIQVILAAKESAGRNGKVLRIISPPASLVGILCQAGFGGEIRFN